MHISVVDIRNKLADVINRAAYGGDRIIIERRGQGVAAMVSMEDLALLEAAEDEHWVKEARKARAQMKRRGEKPIPWEKAKAELGA